MKYLLILILLAACASRKDKCPKISGKADHRLEAYYYKLETFNCYNGTYDTIKIRAWGTLCTVTLEGDTVHKLADGRNMVFKDSVCDARCLFKSDKPF